VTLSPLPAPVTPNLVSESTYWTVPGTLAQVLAFVAAHPPLGGRPALAGNAFDHGTITSSYEGFAYPATPQLSTREVGVVVVAAGPNSTAALIEAADVWVTPRPTSERVPPSAKIVTIAIHSGGLSAAKRPTTRRITVTDAHQVRSIIAAANELPAAQPGVSSCPAGDGSAIVLTFRLTPSGPTLARLRAHPTGCGAVTLTLHGHHEPNLEGGATIRTALERILGISIPR
jgi:hypothetical protein